MTSHFRKKGSILKEVDIQNRHADVSKNAKFREDRI